jgi:FixJ family two-component response regulator
LWRHSLETSLFTRGIGLAEKLPRKAQDEAFTAGILHDLGKLILAQNFPDDYAEVLTQSCRQPRPLWEIETERFGASHAELGAYLMGLWGIGDEVVAAIAHHHQLPAAGTPGRVVAVVYAANAARVRSLRGSAARAGGRHRPEILQQRTSPSVCRQEESLSQDAPAERPCVHNRVLFVDDDPELAAFRRQLRKKVDIETVGSGPDGLEAIRSSGPFSVVVTDFCMPDMNGIEFLTQVREVAPETVRMLLTGSADLNAAIQAVNQGNIFKFLTKPCCQEDLVEALLTGIKKYRQSHKERKYNKRTRRWLAQAMDIQQSLMPSATPDVDGLDIAGRSVYCDQTGGDYYDYFEKGSAEDRRIGSWWAISDLAPVRPAHDLRGRFSGRHHPQEASRHRGRRQPAAHPRHPAPAAS